LLINKKNKFYEAKLFPTTILPSTNTRILTLTGTSISITIQTLNSTKLYFINKHLNFKASSLNANALATIA